MQIVRTHPLPSGDPVLQAIIDDAIFCRIVLELGKGEISNVLAAMLAKNHEKIMVAFWLRIYQTTDLNPTLTLQVDFKAGCIHEIQSEPAISNRQGAFPVAIAPGSQSIN